MFWRRKTSDAKAPTTGGGRRGSRAREDGGGDELAQLQRQFGIKPVSDADVQSEFRALFGGGGATGLSPRSELLLLGGGAGDDRDDDDEAAILRALNIRGAGDGPLDLDALELSDDEDCSDGGAAQRELGGVLREAHATASRHQSQNDPLQPAAVGERHENAAARVHELKLQALALKREGKVKEALALFRQAKDLEAQAAAASAPARAVPAPPMVMAPAAAGGVSSGSFDAADDNDSDVEVTDEDMRNPEFLAQLAKMGLAVDDNPPKRSDTVAAIEAQIQEAKLRALERKRSNDIQEALQWMRKVKELQAQLEQLQSERAAVVMASTATITVESREERRGSYMHSSDTVVVSHAYTSAAVPVDDVPPANDLAEDVEVTEKDMEDPVFAAELLKLGFNPSEKSGEEEEASSLPAAALTSGVEAALRAPVKISEVVRVLQSALSIGDEDLIDEFDEVSDDDNDSSDLPTSTLTSSKPAPATYGALPPEPAALSVPSVSPAQESRELHDGIADLQAQLQNAKETALRLKRDGNVSGALEAMRRMKQIEALLEHKRTKLASLVGATEIAVAPVRDPESQARFQELEHALVDFGNRAFALAKENLSVDRTKATEWLNKVRQPLSCSGTLMRMQRSHYCAVALCSGRSTRRRSMSCGRNARTICRRLRVSRSSTPSGWSRWNSLTSLQTKCS